MILLSPPGMVCEFQHTGFRGTPTEITRPFRAAEKSWLHAQAALSPAKTAGSPSNQDMRGESGTGRNGAHGTVPGNPAPANLPGYYYDSGIIRGAHQS